MKKVAYAVTILLAFCIFTSTVYAEDRRVQFYVYYWSKDEVWRMIYLKNADVTIYKNDNKVTSGLTGDDGMVEFSLQDNTEYTFTVRKAGFKPFNGRFNSGSGAYPLTKYVELYKITVRDGGIWIPVDKLGLLTPYIALSSTIVVATAATAIYVKRRREEQ